MAWDVNQLYSFMKFLIRKNAAGGISNDEFFLAWNSEQRNYQNDLLGKFQKQSNDKTGINTGLIENQTIMTKLTPFTQNVGLNIIAGDAIKPYDFMYELALRISNVGVTHLRHEQIASVISDPIDPPSISDNSYYTVEYKNIYRFMPASVTLAYLDYIGWCPDVIWAYTINVYAYNRKQYNAAASVNPLWDANSIIEITKRTLHTLGVSFKDKDFDQFGEGTIVSGD